MKTLGAREKITRTAKIILIVFLSAGWLLPAYAAIWTYIEYLDNEVSDLLRGLDPMVSFPFLVKVEQWTAITFIWLAAVIVFWAFMGAMLIQKTRDHDCLSQKAKENQLEDKD